MHPCSHMQVLLLTHLEVLDLGNLQPFGRCSDMRDSLLLALPHLPALTSLRLTSCQNPLRALRQALAPLGAALALPRLPLNDHWLQLGQLGSRGSGQSAAQVAPGSACGPGGKPQQAKQPPAPGAEHHSQRQGWRRGLGGGRRQKRSGEEAMGGTAAEAFGLFSFPGGTTPAAGAAEGTELAGLQMQVQAGARSGRLLCGTILIFKICHSSCGMLQMWLPKNVLGCALLSLAWPVRFQKKNKLCRTYACLCLALSRICKAK